MTGAALAAADATKPLTELRRLKRAGELAHGLPRVCELLGRLSDPVDREAAGTLLDSPAAREGLAASDALVPVRVGLLASSTVDAVPPLLTCALLPEGVWPSVTTTGFDQWRMEILSGAPTLAPAEPAVTACLLDDAVVFERVADPLDADEVVHRCAGFAEELDSWLTAFAQSPGGIAVLNTLPLTPRRLDRYVDYATKARVEAAWHRMNAELLSLAERPETVVLSAGRLAARAGAPAASGRMRHLAGHAWGPAFLDAYARELTRVIGARLGRAKKCLVLDLDDTLWGGVVGDDGIGGLRIGGAYPGAAHAELQSLAKDLGRQGVLLAVCSKNDEDVAREAVRTHPEMVLDSADFAAFHAGWGPKPEGVAGLAATLNIGTDAMVFVDDNPAERGMMARRRPEVTVVDLPADPADYASAVASAGFFNQLRLTDEDRARGSLYRARARRDRLRRTAASVEDYLRELDSQVDIEPYGPLNGDRIAQLFGKTNQFNLTGLRYGTAEIARLTAEGTTTFHGVRVRDAYGDNGLVGALALRHAADGWLIENFVLSCRVFSRSIEETVVGLVLRAARDARAAAVHGRYTATAKNGRFAGFYPSLGFTGGDGHFRHDLTRLAELPDWVRLGPGEGIIHVR